MSGDSHDRGIRLLLALIIVAVAARLCSLVWLHPLGWDEIEFFRAADWIRQGLVPYRDFWEHHTPLHWFLYAPITGLIHSPGADAIITMRWWQTPLWLAIFWSINRWMREAGVSRWSRFAAMLLALCSSLFMLAAVEFRVDVLGTLLYILGILLLRESDRSRGHAIAAGVVLCLAGFANLRLGPLLALTVLLARVVRPREEKWEGNPRINWTYAGVIGTFALSAMYFVATHSAAIAYRRLWVENYLGDKYSHPEPFMAWYRFASPFGIRPIETPGTPWFVLASVEPATIAIWFLGFYGVVRALWTRRRNPDHWFMLAFFQVSSILFVWAMKFVYNYHLEIVVIMFLPFVARELDRLADHRKAIVALLLVASAVNVFAALFRGKEADYEYQDTIMREVDRRTKPGDKVFDGVGWALRRKPAYDYWFIPMLVRELDAYGIFETYKTAADDPPAAIVTDYRTFVWIATHPRLRILAGTHYLPAYRNLWIPGMSAVLKPNQQSEWIVPADGEYRVYGSNGLATFLWFRDPLFFGTYSGRDAQLLHLDLRRFPPVRNLTFTIDGQPAAATDGKLTLRRKQILRTTSTDAQPLGVFIVPSYETELFRQPVYGVTIDGVAPPETHVPDFRKLLRHFAF